ncbi:MAG: proline iminopeptidase-family hydrolase [Jatrophihabitans sp.]|uniref:proline iminopeptidase-family hydrolase n=1 Tax=Jatrophihabitans sp. TaxID=1932789 RepID=UPI003915BBB7
MGTRAGTFGEVEVAESGTREGQLTHRGHSVWWGAVGTGTRGSVPLLTVHGGPGICHDCLEPLAGLAADREVVFYDQFGCGHSDRAEEPSEYTIELFVDELAAVRATLGLDRVHLYAHSYGGPLALEYLLSQPEGVLSLTISNSFASVPALAAGWQQRLDELPTHAAQALRKPSADPDEYGAALGEFLTRFVLPFPPAEPLIRSQANSGAEVYQRMHGSSWFVPDGQWSRWDATERLAELNLPTMVIGGRRDQCVPALAEAIAAGIPNAELVILDSAHLPFYEVPDQYLPLLAGFMTRVETSSQHTP